MPKITRGGVSNRLVDPDFIAEPGTPVEKAIDEGLPNVNGTDDQEHDEGRRPDKADNWDPKPPDREPSETRERAEDDEQPKGNDDEESGRDKLAPANQTPAFEPKKSTPAKKTTSQVKK